MANAAVSDINWLAERVPAEGALFQGSEKRPRLAGGPGAPDYKGNGLAWVQRPSARSTKLRRSLRPFSWLFSGWNWVPKMLPRPADEAKGRP
jgi:hypothetical protein